MERGARVEGQVRLRIRLSYLLAFPTANALADRDRTRTTAFLQRSSRKSKARKTQPLLSKGRILRDTSCGRSQTGLCMRRDDRPGHQRTKPRPLYPGPNAHW